MKKYPVKLIGVSKNAIWGGSRLIREYGKIAPDGADTVAESWELSLRDGAINTVANGTAAGESLAAYLDAVGFDSVSPDYDGKNFPLLIKLIDAASPLSVQVHPDDAYAKATFGGVGKTEMWYIVDAEPGASLVMGLRKGVDREGFSRAVAENDYDSVLQSVPVRPGDCFFIPSGMVHAIGAGILIAEIQQNCDTTYRVWDYGRRDAQGNLRQLHVKEALDVVRPFADGEAEAIGSAGGEPTLPGTTLVCCSYFEVSRLSVKGKTELTLPADCFTHLLAVGGLLSVTSDSDTVDCRAGEGVFLPAGVARITLSGDATILLSRPRKG